MWQFSFIWRFSVKKIRMKWKFIHKLSILNQLKIQAARSLNDENISDSRLMNFNIENKWYFHCMICLYFLGVTVILDLCFNFGIFSEATYLDTQLQLE